MRLAYMLVALVAVLPMLVARSARAEGVTVRFPFDDVERLYAFQHDGATAYIAQPHTTEKVPLIVFLHGVNSSGQLHMWMDGQFDLRPYAERLAADVGTFVLAAPSQTKDAATPSTLWDDIDIDDFVAQTASAVGTSVEIDTDRVYVIGHSGAGCNATGGIARAAHAHVRAVMALDTCLDEDSGRSFAPLTRLWVVWQSKTWPRSIAAFRRGLGYAAMGVRIEELSIDAPNAHDAIVPKAFTRAVRTWI